jgi:HK97 family phage prohead protease
MDGLFEVKSISAEVKDIDFKKRIVTGYLSNFGNKDYDNDIIEKGAFKKSITERKDQIYFLNQHNWSQPHGKFNVLIEDSKGLYFESEPLIDTTFSSDVLKMYEAGIMKEHSIGFSTVKSDYDKKRGVRTIKEVKLYEGSNVTMGANPETPFMGMKNLTLKEANDQVSKIVKMLRNGTLTDETFSLLEIALKQLQKDTYKLGLKEASLNEPLNDSTQIEPNYSDMVSLISNFKY